MRKNIDCFFTTMLVGQLYLMDAKSKMWPTFLKERFE
jgi:hypothetical protein